MGLEFVNGNKGCEALSYSFLNILQDIYKEKFDDIHITAIVFKEINNQVNPILQNIKSIKVQPKSIKYWKECKKAFKESDLIFDFSMGDSFSDIYGLKRFILTSLLKQMAINSKTRFILGPQTYGPFNSKFAKLWGTRIIKKSETVFARDELSKTFAEQLSNRKVVLTTDVAFSLNYIEKSVHEEGVIKVGINPSGLLWQGGYTKDNQFHLSVEYQTYCMELIKSLLSDKDDSYKIYLVPHVGFKDQPSVENDFFPCYELKKMFPQVQIVDDALTPMDIKGYIKEMDVFIGARMHATIAAFSMGVATIPFSYSRKFEGLYNSLGYNYTLSAQKIDTNTAISDTLRYIKNFKQLHEDAILSNKKVDILKEEFKEEIVTLFSSK